MRQLGYDRLVVMVTGEIGHSNLLTAEAHFVEEGKEQIVSNYESYFRLIKPAWE